MKLECRTKNDPTHGLENTGEYLDGFGNMIYVYAVGNPEVGTKKNRYEKAHQKGSGFGLVTVDTEEKTYQIDCFRFMIDATDGKREKSISWLAGDDPPTGKCWRQYHRMNKTLSTQTPNSHATDT